MKSCPDCVADIPDGAEVCHSCGNRVVGKPCPDCAELARHAAKKCPHCGHSFAREQKIATVEAYTAKAAQLPTLLLRGRLIPQEIHLSAEKIVIQTWGLFWLSRTDEEAQRMLDNVISIVMPSINPDGTQMIADWYMKYVGTPHEAAGLP